MKLGITFQNQTLIAVAVILSALLLGCNSEKGFAEVELNRNIAVNVKKSSKQLKNSRLQTVLDKAVKDLEIPGAVMYISGPQGTWIGASGYSDLESETLMKPDDKLALASVSKTFVGVAILKLVEQGQLNLNTVG